MLDVRYLVLRVLNQRTGKQQFASHRVLISWKCADGTSPEQLCSCMIRACDGWCFSFAEIVSATVSVTQLCQLRRPTLTDKD